MQPCTRGLAVLLAMVIGLSGLHGLGAAQPIVGNVYDHPGDLWIRPLGEATTLPYHLHDRQLSRAEKVQDRTFCTFDRPGALTILAMDDRTVVARYDAEGAMSARSCASGTLVQLAPDEFQHLHLLARTTGPHVGDPRATDSNAGQGSKAWAVALIGLLFVLALALVFRSVRRAGSPPPRRVEARVDTSEAQSQPPADAPSEARPSTSRSRAKNIRLE